MANLITELWWLLKHGRGWREEHRSYSHPRLGELRFSGTRLYPGGNAHGYWKVQPPGFDAPVGADFAYPNPNPEGLLRLEELLSDLDALFARGERQLREIYEEVVQEPMPQDWRAALRLHHILLPDDEDPELEWQVTYWCEAAQHWFVVSYLGDEVTDVGMEG